MASETELQYLIMADLAAQPELTAAFPGGVWNRLPKPGPGEGATGGVFLPGTPSSPPRMQSTISVLDGGDNPAPGGQAREGFVAFPLVYGWAHAGADGRIALGALGDALRTLYRRGVTHGLDSGAGAELVTLERQPVRDADDFGYAGMLFAVWRIGATYVRTELAS